MVPFGENFCHINGEKVTEERELRSGVGDPRLGIKKLFQINYSRSRLIKKSFDLL